MATDLRNLPAFIDGDATFRTWGLGLQAQLTAMGLVNTADTGQINWTTVTRPAINTSGGYEIWRFADALQATVPVYIRIEYRIGGVADRPGLNITVGSGTNGAGTITGQVGASTTIVPGSSKTIGITLPSYCSGSTSRLSLVTHLDVSSGSFALSVLVERPKDAAGANTANGVMVLLHANSSFTSQLVTASGTVPSAGGTAPFATIASAQTLAGLDTCLMPGQVPAGGFCRFLSCLAYKHTDIGEVVSFTALHLGATRTFMPIGDGGPVPAGTGSALAILYE